MNCPQCNSENPDESLFCNKCGAKLKSQDFFNCPHCGSENPNGAKYCNKCGLSLEKPIPQESRKKSVDENKEKKENLENDKQKSKENKSWFNKKSFFVVLIILYIIVHTVIPDNPVNTDIIYTQNTSEMILTLDDMPDGWRNTGENPIIEGENASSRFYKMGFILPHSVKCDVKKYRTINAAKSSYQEIYNNDHDKTTDCNNVNIGQDSYWSEDAIGVTEKVIFRKGNIIVRVGTVGENAKNYAKKIDKKIDPNKGHEVIYSSEESPSESQKSVVPTSETPSLEDSSIPAIETPSSEEQKISEIIEPNEVDEGIITLKKDRPVKIKNGYYLYLLNIDNSGTKAWLGLGKDNALIVDDLMNINSDPDFIDYEIIDIESDPTWIESGMNIKIVDIAKEKNTVYVTLT